MLPFQRNKVDLSKLNPQEQQLFAKYGKLPTHKSVLMKMQKDRKYFDSGDYALSKAGVAPQSTVGTAIPNPENIPHASSPGSGHNGAHQSLSISPTNSTSPVNKESGLAHDENTQVPQDGEQAEINNDTTETAEVDTEATADAAEPQETV
ncbi:camp-regulated phosphoprotein/endosulfine conserved region-domain-containing protein [Pholiota molesta]|nr:camp-regulated phosphoprotein/endosulfine conserved region-domain-containing protein [Pholiota molesta]